MPRVSGLAEGDVRAAARRRLSIALRRRGRIERADRPEPAEVDDPRTRVAKALAAQADDPDKVRAALVKSAGMSRNLWITFLTFGTYLVIAVGAVTHRQLFLEEPVKLPLLNVDLPLVAFFVVAPILFLIFHAYLLLHLKMMADDARRYTDLLSGYRLDSQIERHIRQQLPNFVFVRLLAGPRKARRSLNEWLLIAIAWLTVAICPVVLLVMTELQFLPYHLEWATWAQRAIIVLDVLLLWCFWPVILRGLGVSTATKFATVAAGIGVSVCLILFSFLIATFPGKSVDRKLMTFQAPKGYLLDELQSKLVSATEYLFHGAVDEVEGKPASWFSNRLVLLDQDFVDDELLGKIVARQPVGTEAWRGERTGSWRGRDLRGAVLVRADLRRADFTGAALEGANLKLASLGGALFGCASTGRQEGQTGTSQSAYSSDGCVDLQRASLDFAQLQSASLRGARLQGASLLGTQLQGASLVLAKLQGTSLVGTRLQGASLDLAKLQGALLSWVELQGASLDRAELQGASLDGAELQGASLVRTQLQGASLDGAKLHGALLDRAELQGASLDRAELQGATFVLVQLQGASLDKAELQGARLENTLLWRTDATTAAGAPFVLDPDSGPGISSGIRWEGDEPLIDERVRERIDTWLRAVPEGKRKEAARTRLEVLLPGTRDRMADQSAADHWTRLEAESEVEATGIHREAEHAHEFRETILSYACEGQAEVAAAIRGILAFQSLSRAARPEGRPGMSELASDLLDCPVATYFDGETLAKLKRLAPTVKSHPTSG